MKLFLTTRWLRQFFVGLLALALLLPPGSRSVAAQSPTTPQADPGFGCDLSPFGRVLSIGREDEVFMSIRNAHPQDLGRLNPYRLNLNTDSGHLTGVVVADLATEPANISALAGAAADLDGDGKTEYIEGFTDGAGQYQVRVHKNGGAIQSHTENMPGHSERAMAAGDVLGLRDGTQQVVIASRGNDGVLNVAVFAGTPNGDNVGSPIARWRASVDGRANASQIHVAVGNLNNNPFADIVVSFVESGQHGIQLVYLEYEAGFQAGSGADSSQNLHERAKYAFQVNPPKHVELALANLNGGSQDMVVLAWARQGPGGVSPLLVLSTLRVDSVLGVVQFVDHQALSFSTSTRSFAVGTGDVNGDQRDEIVLGYDSNDPNSGGLLNMVTYGMVAQVGAAAKLTELDRWQDGADGRNLTDDLALAVGDLDKDMHADVVAAFKDANGFGFQDLYLRTDQNKHLQLMDWGRQDSTIDSPPVLALGDWDNDSLRAVLQGKCARVVDGIITAASFVPPYWQNIQQDQDRGGSMGRSVTQEQAAENSVSLHRADTLSFYAGLSAGITTLFAEFSASAKLSAAREHSTSDRRTTTTMTTTVTTVGQSWVNDALVFEPAEYSCFSYQLAVDSTFIPTDQAALRFCEYQPLPGNTPPLEANELDSWDINSSDQPEYTPVVRDWSSLALFRGAFTDQSSNAVTAKLAVDSEIVSGSFANATPAQTDLQANPWWQVDLGASEAIGKIRLWTPPASLSNAYVLVSNTDFRSIPGHENPANLLNRPDVQAYTLADLGSGLTMTGTAGSVATFTTLSAQHLPITGRYVRVQRADTAKLVLAEVQVFGANHVEPNRYPLNVRDTAPNDGMFEVQLYNPLAQNVTYEWKKVRGNLLWYEPQNGLLNGLTIGRGNAIRDWSLSKAVGQGQAQAHEIDNSTSVGAELEAEAGVGVKVLAGVGKENTVGLATEVVESTSWTNEFNMGGLMQAFPPTYNGHENDWVENCRYRFIPYQYEVTETSNLGYHQRFPVLDYVVPDDNRASDLHRTSNVMPDCRNGNLLSTTPQAVNDTVVITAPVPTGIQVLANDLGNELKIVDAGPAQNGNVIFASRTITYTPNAGFQGIDSFNYVMAPDAAAGAADLPTVGGEMTGTVTVTVGIVEPVTPPSVFLPYVQR